MTQFSSSNTASQLRDSDVVSTFQLETSSVRGRITKLGDATIDSILKRHDYPEWAAKVLGEALALAVMTAATLKVSGRIMVQAEGNGPVKLLVAEAHTDGGLRGYVQLNDEKWAALVEKSKDQTPTFSQMIGQGIMGLVIIQDQKNTDPYQGIVPIDGDSLAECAQHYFNQSEQIPTRVKLSVEKNQEEGGTVRWRAGGTIIQQVANDENREDTQNDWDTARALFETIEDNELTSETLNSSGLLYRLFHEDGVRLEMPKPLLDKCPCSQERLISTLAGMPKVELLDMAEGDNELVADCQFCGRIYRIPTEDVLKQQS